MPLRQQGFSMIEVLVTIVVVSFGMLGFAGLLNESIVSNRQAHMRSQATLLAHDIIERMRVNRPAAVSGQYSIALATSPASGTLAGNDLVEWKGLLASYLPAGDGSVVADGAGNVTVVVTWDDDGDGAATTFSTQSNI
jgi:type IV pilus assembly protein PilV